MVNCGWRTPVESSAILKNDSRFSDHFIQKLNGAIMLSGKISSYFSLFLVILLSLSLQTYASGHDGRDEVRAEMRKYTSNLPFTMPEIQLPEFPNNTFNIVDYSAVGDGHTMNTEAFKKAIDACANGGGGTVIVPQGLWLTGPIELKSNVNLRVERGAIILFSRNHNDYPIIKSPTRGFVVASPIYGFDLENVAVTGAGLLDGSGVTWRPVKKSKVTSSMWKEFVNSGGVLTDGGTIWWPSQEAADGARYLSDLKARKDKKDLTPDDFLPARDFMRPILLLFSNCKSVLIEGVTLENSPAYALYPDHCEDVIVRNVKVNNEYWAQNSDGIDIASSKNVLVYKCTVTAGDDGICMKSSKGKSGEPALKNVVIADCVVYHAHGGFVIGSNTDGGMENISVRNCDYVGTDIGLRFKSARGRGGVVKNIYVNNIYMKDIVNEAILFDTYYEGLGPGERTPSQSSVAQALNERTPIFQDFHIDSIFCNGAKQAVRVAGLPEMPIKDITITNSYIVADKGFGSYYASGFTLKNVQIVPKKGEVYSLDESKDFVIEKGYCPLGTDVFMSVNGKASVNIRLVNTSLSSAKNPIKYGADVDKSAVACQ